MLDRLEDRSAAGILAAAEEGRIPADGEYAPLLIEAREMVENDQGDWLYIGSLREDMPQWEPPTGEKAVEPPRGQI